jgi:hypothetical protein
VTVYCVGICEKANPGYYHNPDPFPSSGIFQSAKHVFMALRWLLIISQGLVWLWHAFYRMVLEALIIPPGVEMQREKW